MPSCGCFLHPPTPLPHGNSFITASLRYAHATATRLHLPTLAMVSLRCRHREDTVHRVIGETRRRRLQMLLLLLQLRDNFSNYPFKTLYQTPATCTFRLSFRAVYPPPEGPSECQSADLIPQAADLKWLMVRAGTRLICLVCLSVFLGFPKKKTPVRTSSPGSVSL